MAPSAAWIERLSIISIAPGTMPVRDDLGDRLAGDRSCDSKKATSVRTVSGFGITRSEIFVATPERALGADEGAEQVVAGRVELLAAELHHVPSGSTSSRPVT